MLHSLCAQKVHIAPPDLKPQPSAQSARLAIKLDSLRSLSVKNVLLVNSANTEGRQQKVLIALLDTIVPRVHSFPQVLLSITFAVLVTTVLRE